MEVVLRAEDAKDWFYKGEGAANLVLGYRGSSPNLVGKVVRIQKKVARGGKESMDKPCLFTVHEKLLWGDIGDLVEATSKETIGQVYVMRVISPLLGSEHIDPGFVLELDEKSKMVDREMCNVTSLRKARGWQLVGTSASEKMQIVVSREFLASVERIIHSQRPVWRLDATKVDDSGSALMISDHSVISSGTPEEDLSIAVEIKPKCGFLPSSEFIAKINARKKDVTRFRMHQFLKLHKCEISQISEYDPLDLFSGSKDRINRAVKALYATPQNNFRIFLNGSLIFGGLGGGLDNTECEANQSNETCKNFQGRVKVLIEKYLRLRLDSFLELVTEAISESGILEPLLAAQKLDVFDIEGAIHAYYNIISQPCIACKNCSDPELLHGYSWLHSLPLEESLKIVRDYLIAATVKDCSLMISFRPREVRDSSSTFIKLRSSEQIFEYKVNYIDLDLKPLKKMVYYYELDQKIVNFYTKNEENKGP